VDDRCSTYNSMAAWVGDRLYDGLFYSHPAGRCNYHSSHQSNSGAETIVAMDFIADHYKKN
jgi:hypothetical protein